MSKLLGLSNQAYYEILKQKSTTIKTLEKIAEILDTQAKDLLT